MQVTLSAGPADIRLTEAEEQALADVMTLGRTTHGAISRSAAATARAYQPDHHNAESRLQERKYLAVKRTGELVVDTWVAAVLGTFALGRVIVDVRVRVEGATEQRVTFGRVGHLAVERSVEANGDSLYRAVPAPAVWLERLVELAEVATLPAAVDASSMLVRRSRLLWARALGVSDGPAAAAASLVRDGMPALTAEALAATLADARSQVGLSMSARQPGSTRLQPIYGLTLLSGPRTAWVTEELTTRATHLVVQSVDALAMGTRLQSIVALAWSL
ncbi:MAG TPA: hypothetical protein VKV73_01200 [Chloroflexota bacterium]|nr:hypothetical protein [Chloroflexota bacterium]